MVVILRHQRMKVGAAHFNFGGGIFPGDPRISLRIKERSHRDRAGVASEREREMMKLRNFIFGQGHGLDTGRRWIEEHDVAAELFDQFMLERDVVADAPAVDDAPSIKPGWADGPGADGAGCAV